MYLYLSFVDRCSYEYFRLKRSGIDRDNRHSALGKPHIKSSKRNTLACRLSMRSNMRSITAKLVLRASTAIHRQCMRHQAMAHLPARMGTRHSSSSNDLALVAVRRSLSLEVLRVVSFSAIFSFNFVGFLFSVYQLFTELHVSCIIAPICFYLLAINKFL
jgi:hypothetical protein